jgi:hypothetical protein
MKIQLDAPSNESRICCSLIYHPIQQAESAQLRLGLLAVGWGLAQTPQSDIMMSYASPELAGSLRRMLSVV